MTTTSFWRIITLVTYSKYGNTFYPALMTCIRLSPDTTLSFLSFRLHHNSPSTLHCFLHTAVSFNSHSLGDPCTAIVPFRLLNATLRHRNPIQIFLFGDTVVYPYSSNTSVFFFHLSAYAKPSYPYIYSKYNSGFSSRCLPVPHQDLLHRRVYTPLGAFARNHMTPTSTSRHAARFFRTLSYHSQGYEI